MWSYIINIYQYITKFLKKNKRNFIIIEYGDNKYCIDFKNICDIKTSNNTLIIRTDRHTLRMSNVKHIDNVFSNIVKYIDDNHNAFFIIGESNASK